MKISIADFEADAKGWAVFFSDNMMADYVSHSELQGHRAIAPGRWSPNAISVLEKEIRARLSSPLKNFPVASNWQGVIVATDKEVPIGVSFVSTSVESAVPFGVIEDIIIDKAMRGQGNGEKLMQWIIDQFARAGFDRVFLESGIRNERAHEFFEKQGLKQVSVVMMRDLALLWQIVSWRS